MLNCNSEFCTCKVLDEKLPARLKKIREPIVLLNSKQRSWLKLALSIWKWTIFYYCLYPSLFRCFLSSTLLSVSVLAEAALLEAQHGSALFRSKLGALWTKLSLVPCIHRCFLQDMDLLHLLFLFSQGLARQCWKQCLSWTWTKLI